MTEWIHFIRRGNFAMTAERLQGLLPGGHLILAGPTLGAANTGVAIFEASDEQATRQIMAEDPVIIGGMPALIELGAVTWFRTLPEPLSRGNARGVHARRDPHPPGNGTIRGMSGRSALGCEPVLVERIECRATAGAQPEPVRTG